MIKFLTLMVMAVATLVELAFYADSPHLSLRRSHAAGRAARRRRRSSGPANADTPAPASEMAAVKP